MQYISTGHNSPSVTLAQAVLCSHAPDGGLYMPASLPQIPDAFFRNFQGMTASEIAYVLATHFFSDDIPAQALKEMVDRTINFDIPLRRIDNDIYVLELFGGPTLTFKDIGARFMASLLRHIGTGSLPLNIIVASCGNTAGAIANAMAPLSSVNVFVLFPRNSSNRQLERQYTTLVGNIHAIEVHGNIDDCLALMRQALSDPVLQRKAMMTCANSANIGRLLPETFYYFYGVAQLLERIDQRSTEIVAAIPCGNLGNLTGGIISKRLGLPISHFIACENANDAFNETLATGHLLPRRPSVPTLAYATDKADPTNLPRILDLYHYDFAAIRRDITGECVNDVAIIEAVNGCYRDTGYMCDPHTAMAYYGLRRNLRPGQTGLIIATAHPAKSLAAMNAITGRAMDLPLQLNAFMTGQDHRIRISPNYNVLRHIITDNTPTPQNIKQ